MRRLFFLVVFGTFCFNSRTREGATDAALKSNVDLSVSIHAPVRVRLSEAATPFSALCFNSRTREGATKKVGYNEPLASFNSRTREGATRRRMLHQRRNKFQFTHP